MNGTLYLDAKIDKQLQALRRAAKKAELACRQAEDIIGRMQAGKISSHATGVTTKHGELRLKGCVKYDLGGGYRLVTIRQGRDIFILFVGTHDDCHRWIENNRALPLNEIKQRSQCFPIGNGSNANPDDGADTGRSDTAGKDIGDRLKMPNDSQLRSIFGGLVQSVQSSASS